jgi:dolichyl-diphosphooligosaccharide---protein glycosyltransferase
VSLANGGTAFTTTSNDWLQAFSWMRQLGSSTTIASWWDYGYWMTVMGNVTSLADNATINETQISLIGQALVDPPQQSLQVLRELHSPQYILIFVTGYILNEQSNGGGIYYMLTVPTPYPQPGGGDESKKQWFIRIGNVTCGCLYETNGPKALMQPDDFTPTPYFWTNSTFGQLIPYSSQGLFYNPVLSAQGSSSATAQSYSGTVQSNGASGIGAGYTELYTYQMKYPATNSTNPFQIAFQSSSMTASSGLITAVLIYKINYNATTF